MDFKKRATIDLCETPSVLHVEDPETGEPLMDGDKPVTISVLGAEGRTYIGLLQEQTQKQIDVLARRRHKQVVPNAEANAKAQTMLIAKCTTAWSGIEWEGAVLVLSEANAVMLYTQCPWLQAQVEDHMHRMENYLGNA